MAVDLIARGMAGDAASVAHKWGNGRFLSIWNCTTGMPLTNPTSLPYEYKTGDYYRVGAVANGSYNHAITLAGTASQYGIHEGTYSVSFTISNNVATQYTTIAAIAAALGEDGVTATGVLHTTDAGDLDIITAIEWEQEGNLVVALLDDTRQKVALTTTTANTLTDTVSGGTTNYKPNGSSYTGAASTTTETDTDVAVGWTYYYDGTTWKAAGSGAGGEVMDVKLNGTSIVDDSTRIVSMTADTTPTNGSSNLVTSGGVYTGLNAKQDTITGGASTIATSNLTVNRALISNASGKVAVSAVTSTELGYLDGVTSNIQTQLSAKVSKLTTVADTTSTTATLSMASDKLYTYSQALTSLTVSAVADHAAILFTAGASVSVTMPSGVTYAVATPSFTQGSTYYLEFSVVGSTTICDWAVV